jgi:3-hydroxyacyl-[acyl-carrier-protein] dehydratase
MQTAALALDAGSVRRASPYGNPFVLLDGVGSYETKPRRLVAFKNVSQNEPFLQGHFPDFPILPGVLIIEALSQACRLLMHLDRLAETGTPPERLKEALLATEPPRGFLVESQLKHTEGVYPGNRMELEARIVGREEELYTFKVVARADGIEVGRGRIVLLRSSQETFEADAGTRASP